MTKEVNSEKEKRHTLGRLHALSLEGRHAPGKHTLGDQCEGNAHIEGSNASPFASSFLLGMVSCCVEL